jgi:RHS repeat-associated protein
MDFNSSGSLEMWYLNGPTGVLADSVIARESAGGTIAWYLPDRLGTVRDLINNAATFLLDHIEFSAFGTVLAESDPSEGDRMMGFAGMEQDPVTGLNLAVNRVQNPGTGRWDSQDPEGFAAGDDDLYRYVDNEPADRNDPLGLGESWYPGHVIVGPRFNGPVGTTIIPEKSPKPIPIPPPGSTSPGADAVILPCAGLIKLPGGAISPFGGHGPTVTLVSYDPATGDYTIEVSPGSGGTSPVFFPIGTFNPFGPDGDVPGNGTINEGTLPQKTRKARNLVPWPSGGPLVYTISCGGESAGPFAKS